MSKKNHNTLLDRIQNYMMSYSGKTLINYFYSWGAAIVILGTLFKLTHLPGANLMLYIGMGTEVLVFIISAFDRPAKTYRWESVFPNLEIAGREVNKNSDAEGEDLEPDSEVVPENPESPVPGAAVGGASIGGPSVVYVGGGTASSGTGAVASGAGMAASSGGMDISGVSDPVAASGSAGAVAGGAVAGGMAGGIGLPTLPQFPAEELEEATQAYLDKLKEMTETIGRMNEQINAFACDPEQMEGVNRHIAGLNAIFELQLRSASKQVESVDKVHEQTERMAAQIEELNKVYARMLQAMTANMIHQQQSANQ